MSNADLIARRQKRLDEATEALRELCDALAAQDEIIAALRESLLASDRALAAARDPRFNK